MVLILQEYKKSSTIIFFCYKINYLFLLLTRWMVWQAWKQLSGWIWPLKWCKSSILQKTCRKKAMKETLQFNLYHLFTKICQIKPYSVLYQQNNCNTSTDVQSYQHHKMLFTSTSIIHQIYHLTSDFVDLVANIWSRYMFPSVQFSLTYSLIVCKISLPIESNKGLHHHPLHG